MIEIGKKARNLKLINKAYKYMINHYSFTDQLETSMKYCQTLLQETDATIKTKLNAYYFIGYYYSKIKNFVELKKVFYILKQYKEIKLNRINLVFLFYKSNLAESFYQLGYYVDAIECSKNIYLEKSLNEKTTYYEDLGVICESFIELGNYENCLRMAKLGITIPKEEEMHSEYFCFLPLFQNFTRLCLFILEGKQEKVEFQERALESDFTKSFMAILNVKILIAHKEFANALFRVKEYIKKLNFGPQLHKLGGIAAMMMGNYQEALQFFDQSVQQFSFFNSTHSELKTIFLYIAEIFHKLGNNKLSCEFMKKSESIEIITFLSQVIIYNQLYV